MQWVEARARLTPMKENNVHIQFEGGAAKNREYGWAANLQLPPALFKAFQNTLAAAAELSPNYVRQSLAGSCVRYFPVHLARPGEKLLIVKIEAARIEAEFHALVADLDYEDGVRENVPVS